MVTLTKRFDRAVKMARKEHKNQARKGTEIPYISHLLGVTSIVLEMEGTEDQAIAALLHDAVEDGGGPQLAERIRKEFGKDVARMVLANTDSDVKPKPPWRVRKTAYLATIPEMKRDELLIALADKLHNSRSNLLEYRRIGDDIWPRFKEGRKGQLWYYRQLVKHFTARADDLGPLCASKLDDFVRTIDELSRD